jgi:hypothetical protein
MNRFVAGLLAWAMAGGLSHAWAADARLGDRLCPLSAPALAPVSTTVAGCSAAWCTAVGDEQACNCQRGERWVSQRRRGGQLVQQWATEVSPMMGPEALQVTLADVDGDGQPEWLLSQFQSQSNGLGVSTHRLCVLRTAGKPQAPVCREVSEWQQLTVLVQEAGRSGCSLMDSGWQSGRNPAPKKGRGPGTYAVGQLLRLHGGRWQAAQGRAQVSRRLLDDFMNERETLPQSNAQRLWYQHPSAEPSSPLGR